MAITVYILVLSLTKIRSNGEISSFEFSMLIPDFGSVDSSTETSKACWCTVALEVVPHSNYPVQDRTKLPTGHALIAGP